MIGFKRVLNQALFTIISALILADLATPAPIYAERPSPEVLQAVAEELGVAPESRQFQNLIAKMSDDFQPQSASSRDVVDSIEWEKIPLVRHYRAQLGVPIPKQDEIRGIFHGVTEDDFFKLFKEGVERYKDLEQEWRKIPALPRCSINRRDKKQNPFRGHKPEKLLGKNSDKVANVLLVDMIFLNEEDIPEKPAEVFGQRAIVRRYEPNNPFAEGAIASKLNLSCLPYRYRVTFDYTLEYQGLEAMKNYDKDTYGEGEIHPWVQENYLKGRSR